MARNRSLFGIPNPFNKFGKSLRSFSAPPKSPNYNRNIDIAKIEAKKIIEKKNEINYLVDAANEILNNYFSIDVPFININEKIEIMEKPFVTAELTYKAGVQYSGPNKNFWIKNKVTYNIFTNEVDFKNVYGVNLNDALSVDFDNLGISIKQRIYKSCENVDCTVAVNFYFYYCEIVYSIKAKNNNSYILGELKIHIEPTEEQRHNYYNEVYDKAPSLQEIGKVAFKVLAVAGIFCGIAATIYTGGAAMGCISTAACLL